MYILCLIQVGGLGIITFTSLIIVARWGGGCRCGTGPSRPARPRSRRTLLAWSRLRGDEVTSLAERSIPEETIQRAVGLFVVTFAVTTVGILVMATAETEAGRPRDFLRYMFEAVSAFNTVGLTMGATPHLTPTGKATAILFMFAGRVGPLVLGAALVFRRHPSGRVRYAYEDVVVG